MTKVMVIFGTRPEIVKMAPIIRKISEYNMEPILIHSGQHYDIQMSQIFLQELEIGKVDENLLVGSGTHAEQTAKLLQGYEKVIIKYKPDIVLALGDTNSVVAAGLVCIKMNVPFGHVEGGIRSYDLTMPEEINRILAGSSAAIHFSPSKQAVLNLLYEGTDPRRIYLTGNTIVDAVKEHSELAERKSTILQNLKLPKDKPIITATVHRPQNVNDKSNLENICKGFIELNDFSIVFPVHPRTRKQLVDFKLIEELEKHSHIKLSEPLGYLDFLMLMKSSEIIITDSGGLQEEALCLEKPCITLRTNTERPETVELGVNFLVGSSQEKIVETVHTIIKSNVFSSKINFTNPYGDGEASRKILEIISERMTKNDLVFVSPVIKKGSRKYRLLKIEVDTTKTKIEKKYQSIVTLLYNEKGEPQIIQEKIPKSWYVRILN